MRFKVSLAAISVAIAGPSFAQTTIARLPVAPTEQVPTQDEEQAVTAYPPEFFAAARPNTALDMVQRLPGFNFDGGSSVRGFAGGGGNVLIDGARSLTKTESLEETLRKIPASTVARIEIVRGGAPGIDMQGRTVLANVVRRPGGGGGIAYTHFFIWDGRGLPGVRAEAQRRWNGRAFEVSLLVGQGPDDALADGERVRVDRNGAVLIRSQLNTQGGGTRYWATGAYETPIFGGQLRVNAVIQRNPFHSDFVDVLSVPGGVELEQDRIGRENYEFGGRFTRGLGQNILFEGLLLEQLTRTATTVNFTSPTVSRLFDLDTHTGETIARSTFTWRAARNLSVEFGGEGAFNWLESQTALTVNNSPVNLPAANVRVEELRGELFGLATWRPHPTLNVEAGLRFEASTITSTGDTALEKTLSYPKPRLVLTWSPNATNQVRFRVEREVGQLNFNDFVAASSVANTGTAIAGNPDINPQQAWVIEAAYEHRFWQNGQISLTLRHSEITDVVDRIPLIAGNTVIDAPGNIGSGTRDEAILALSIPLARFGLPGAQIRPTATWRRSEVTDPVTGQSRPISAVHAVDFELHFTQDLPRWRLNWGVDVNPGFGGGSNGAGGFRETNYRVTEITSRVLHNYVTVFSEYKPRPNLILRFEVQNLLGRDAITIREVYAGPRNTSLLSYVDTRSLHPGPSILFRIRQTF